MANAFLKAEQIVSAAIGLLERAVVLPSLVWRDAGGSFQGAKNDTISIRLPAYANSRKRTLRTGSYTLDELNEHKVDVTLDSDIYKAVGITDEELTLDIFNFGAQVLQPVVSSVARGMEDELADTITGATYEVELEIDGTDPYLTLVDARKALNDANVPFGERSFICGSSVEAALLKSEHLAQFQMSGDSSAFRDAVIGRIAGFTAISVPDLPPDEAYAFHRTAFVLSTQAPVVPAGVAFGSSAAFAGMAMRVIRDYDFDNVRDRLLVNSYMGSNTVADAGEIDSATGKFIPAEDPDASGVQEIIVRAVKLTLES